MLPKQKLFIFFKLQIVSTRTWSFKSINVFCNLFDLSRREFDSYRKKTQLPTLDIEHLNEISNFREKINIPKHQWILFPILLKEPARHLEQWYLQLREGGFEHIDASVLANCRKLMRKSIRLLKTSSFLPAHVNVTESFLKNLDPKPQMSLDNLSDECSFQFLFHSTLTSYLMMQFRTSKDTIDKFYRTYPTHKIKSLNSYIENLKLAEEIGFPTDDIFHCGYLLHAYPETTRQLLENMPTLAGIDIREVIKSKPKLLGVPYKNLEEIYYCLRDANISDDAIQHYLPIFYLNPNTVALRIKDACSQPDFQFFLNDPNFLKLIIHYNEAGSRMSFLNEMKLKCTSISALCCPPDQFTSYLQHGFNVHQHTEVTRFIQQLLNSNSKQIEINLKKHPYFRYVNLKSVQESYQFLHELKFNNEAMINVVAVLLYSKEKLKAAYDNVRDCMKYDTNQVEQLNLILYFMEREHHFTGNGIWNNTENA